MKLTDILQFNLDTYNNTTFKELAVFWIVSLDVRAGTEVITDAVLATLNTGQTHAKAVEADTK